MYKIEKRPYGFVLTFGEFMRKAEMDSWYSESRKQLAGTSGPFGIMVDMRTLKPLPEDAQGVMVQGQKLYKDAGMERSVVILNNAVTTAQFRRLAKESGISAWERYIDASSQPKWEEKAVNWIKSGTDPDKVA
jgi:hypothetical protein